VTANETLTAKAMPTEKDSEIARLTAKAMRTDLTMAIAKWKN
jgi:uncharacterized protein (UPF0254 family)